ncbi:MAG: UDP-N-acetylmuramoyl-tripeptide--D-alanyl-D-alanine ligase [Candidatus Pacebacteria bacterium]|nr:UDP-N-acetylmuramoyl-tripeptide--D-alanyl-D-alanine ligase [Candidatus Paceibacterota bacterium]MDD4074197.1 UDP-N-acetylmuramoyl-tripeptide--D-alanyl-D-alanine ligase [Candidatus Paceibacterota bacterium]
MIKIIFISLFFLKEIKSLLFWLYLWQLKNYHIGRFLAHFDTYKGKRLLINYFLRVLLLILSLYNFYFFYVIAFLYLIEIIYSKIIYPQKTSKTLFLSIILILILPVFLFFIYNFDLQSLFSLIVLFDILTPIMVSFVVLFLQPITVLLRNRIINKAIKKRKSLDNLLTIGITGSYGKSTTKEYLKIILSNSFNVITTPQNKNSEMGISKCILDDVNENHEIFICEMGAYNRGGIKLLSKIAQPKIGVITGINNQHLATFGSQKNIVKTKFELIEFLPLEGLAVLNWDNQYIKDNFKKYISSIKCGLDVWAKEIKDDSFKFCSLNNEEGEIIKIKNIKPYNISNLLICISLAKKLGMTMEEIKERVLLINDPLETSSYKNFDVINATYSSNFNGIISHLDYLKRWTGNKVIIMPCLIELGAEGKNTHYEIGRKIGEVCDLAIITTNDYKKELIAGAKYSGMENIVFTNKTDKIDLLTKNNSVILLESRIPKEMINKLKDE